MVWDINTGCTGHFLDLFEPIQNVKFIKQIDIQHYGPGALTIYEPNHLTYRDVLKLYNMSLHHPIRSWGNLEKQAYLHFKPTPENLQTVLSFVHAHNICNSIAVHVRRTDLHGVIEKFHLHATTDSEFYKFIDSFPSSTPIFLMTDNWDTRSSFLNRYQNRLIVYANMSHLPNNSSNSSIRATSLRDTLVDVLIATHSKSFKGSTASSLSYLVTVLRQIRGGDYCKKIAQENVTHSSNHRLSPNSTHRLSPNSTHTLSPNSTHRLSPNSTHRLSPNSTHKLRDST